MATEDEMLQLIIDVFQDLRGMVQGFQGKSLSPAQQRRMMREVWRDLSNNDPRVNTVRQQVSNPQSFEKGLAARANEILDERFEPENADEQNRDPQQVEAPEAAHGEEALVADEPERPERVEVLELQTFLDGDRIRNTWDSQLLFPDGDRSPAPGAVPGPAEQNRDPRQVEMPEVEAPEAAQGEQFEAPEAVVAGGEVPGVKEAEAAQQGPVLGQADNGQLVSPAIGDDAPPAAEWGNTPIYAELQAEQQALEQAETPIYTQFVNERARQGQERPEGEIASPAGVDQGATGDASNKPAGQGQVAAAQSPELPAAEQRLRYLHNGGQLPAPGAVQPRDGATAASPPASAHHPQQTSSKDSDGRPGRGD
jgi:hypothetical protein